MAANEKEAYLALIAAHDPEIRTLLDHGFDFVTNAFKAGAAPSPAAPAVRLSSMPGIRGVSVAAGFPVLTGMPRGAHPGAAARINPMPACLLVVGGDTPCPPRTPAVEEVMRILPPPRVRMTG